MVVLSSHVQCPSDFGAGWVSNGVCLAQNNHPAFLHINVRACSLLIDVGEAMFNLSALVGLHKPSDHDTITMRVLASNSIDFRGLERSVEGKQRQWNHSRTCFL